MIAANFEEAQISYCRKYWIKRISLAEAQHIAGHLNAGLTADEAAVNTRNFFEMHRKAMEYASGFEPGPASIAAYEKFCDEYEVND